MVTTDVLRRIIARLEAASIPFMLTGSMASAVHGAPRATQDIDLVIEADEPRIRALVRSLPAEEYYVDESAAIEALHAHSLFNIVDRSTGWKIDLIIRKSRPFSVEEFARRRRVEIDGVPLAVVTAEDTIIAKLEWARSGGSARQLEDVATILRIRAGQLDVARIEHWVGAMGLEKEWTAARTHAGDSGDSMGRGARPRPIA
jgi:predicted nucleotidyltransferase